MKFNVERKKKYKPKSQRGSPNKKYTDTYIYMYHIHAPHFTLYLNQLHLNVIAGHGVTPAAGSECRIMGTCFTTENASFKRTTLLLNWDIFCRNQMMACLLGSCKLKKIQAKWYLSHLTIHWYVKDSKPKFKTWFERI